MVYTLRPWGPVHTTPGKYEKKRKKGIKCFPSTLLIRQGNFNTQQSPVTFGQGNNLIIVTPSVSKSSVLLPLVNEKLESSGLKNDFRDGLHVVWSVGLTLKIKVRFQICPEYCEHSLGLVRKAFRSLMKYEDEVVIIHQTLVSLLRKVGRERQKTLGADLFSCHTFQEKRARWEQRGKCITYLSMGKWENCQ